MPPLTPEDAAWFSQEVEPHGPALRAWLRKRFPAIQDIDDIVQESFLRVLEVHARSPARHHAVKALLFTTARNLVLDALRRRKIVQFDHFSDEESAAAEGVDVAEEVSLRHELELMTEAVQSLPERCRQVLTLRKIYGLSQKETAEQLGIAEKTVEVHVTVGIRRCIEFFARRRLR